ncbi:MAG: PqqD family protein [Oscillospiraceae bacterium]|nr:PqqD family protein [Oscillospiraceae bacterium]MCL2277952.1 PqqD family protein [Oscillospiraceae bacterium]
MIDNMNQLSRKNDAQLRKLDETYYIIAKNSCFEANEIGATIMNAIGKDLHIDDVCSKLSSRYEYDDVEGIKSDVYSFIEFLIENDIAELHKPM